MTKILAKLKIIVIILVNTVAHSICNLKHSIPIEIHVVFHNGSNFRYDFIIKKASKRVSRRIQLSRRKY